MSEDGLNTKDNVNKLRMDIQGLIIETRQLEYRLVIKLGALMTAIIATAVAVLKIH